MAKGLVVVEEGLVAKEGAAMAGEEGAEPAGDDGGSADDADEEGGGLIEK